MWRAPPQHPSDTRRRATQVKRFGHMDGLCEGELRALLALRSVPVIDTVNLLLQDFEIFIRQDDRCVARVQRSQLRQHIALCVSVVT